MQTLHTTPGALNTKTALSTEDFCFGQQNSRSWIMSLCLLPFSPTESPRKPLAHPRGLSRYGCGSKPKVPFWGILKANMGCSPGYRGFDPQPYLTALRRRQMAPQEVSLKEMLHELRIFTTISHPCDLGEIFLKKCVFRIAVFVAISTVFLGFSKVFCHFWP